MEEEDIKSYIRRAIIDIARKCNTTTDKVIKTIKEII